MIGTIVLKLLKHKKGNKYQVTCDTYLNTKHPHIQLLRIITAQLCNVEQINKKNLTEVQKIQQQDLER